ncbi:flavodoxin domain-containing protein [Virgibacillus sp. NKC19-16]|uniref:flavodoxin domain-containing protein n=1 Tax=Virgibacillus salidurans TaxID=2831673 RepID=UPI001F228E43|nr:flavodoxin domain-containing protein [Virgibacillus sp. NKC19-16]UJL46704.1 flavodoxin domain-containing protein [Virgibacillus sp. NKC19-16]
MAKLLMLYASGTGNTELMAEAMVAYLENKNHAVVTKTFDFDPIDVAELLEYDAILIGTHTWDDGDLPYEVEDFYEELDDVAITGKLFGVFGSADSFYDTYGGAVDLMADRLSKAGAVLVPEQLKVDLEPDRVDIERCEQLAETVLVMADEEMKRNAYL